ncbi:MAG: polymer-forming cytoskeletal protein [Rhizomicrobium sp.]|jgi:cytoskeletal protein CcmA (bactofilin family)
MTVFSRSEKPSDPTSSAKAQEKGDTAMSTYSDPKPVPAQPMSGTAPTASAARPAPQASASIISKALKITGQLESTEDIEIEGEVDGDVRAVSVKVGPNAKVKGTVYGDEVELSGTVDGKIEAKKVVLTRTAHMSGDVIHQDIRIESGAFIDGHCRPEFGKTEGRSSSSKSLGVTVQPEKPNGAGAKI